MNSFFNMFRKRSPEMIARQELQDAQRLLLVFHAQREYYDSMVLCMEHRINRLKKFMLTDGANNGA